MGMIHKGRGAQNYLSVFARWLWLIMLCTVIGTAGAFVAAKAQHPVYRATTLLIVSQRSSNVLITDSQIATATLTYAQMINQPVVIQKAASQVGGVSAAELTTQVQASAESNTSLIDLSVDDINPKHAAVLANAVASAFISVLNKQAITNNYSIDVFQPATPPALPDHPKLVQYSLVGGTLGFAIATVYIYLVLLFNSRSSASQESDQRPEQIIIDSRQVAKR